jgi:restriction system protein
MFGAANTGGDNMDSNSRRCAPTWTDIVARMPWWVGLAPAIASYWLLHTIAARPQTIIMDPSRASAELPGLVIGWVADALQFVVPAVCVLSGAMVRGARQLLRTEHPHAHHAEHAMTRVEFEILTSGGLRMHRRPRPARAAQHSDSMFPDSVFA